VGYEYLPSQIPSNKNRVRKIKEIIKIKWEGWENGTMRPGQAVQGREEGGGRSTKVQHVSFEYFTSRGCYARRGQGSKLGTRTANWV